MKALQIVAVLFLIVSVSSCKKKINKDVTVIRDCTGTYLEFKDQDYKVCNWDKVEDYGDGDKVQASFKKIDSCDDPNTFNCEMYHEYKSWIKVTKIK